MTTLTDAQIAGLAKGVGMSGDKLVTAVAVALAESGGRTDVLGPPTQYGRAVGVWQIMPLAGRPNTAALKDPNVNAQQMAKISNGGTNWKPWEAYTNGSYRLFLPRAKKAAGNPDSTGVEQASAQDVSNPLSWPGKIVDFFTLLTDPITWMRLGMIVSGGLLVGVALMQLSGAGSKLGQVASTAVDFVPGGGAVKKVATAAKAGS